jgi:hypothetical protein
MVLKKVKLVFKEKGVKPTRFRFKDNIRLGFRNNKVVEIAKFKEVKRRKK